ncbi:HAD hydrolase-like protein [Virgibacillus sp. LDC-1]|uniref:HAD hydrolase-like protein n=1 Tax=Virgibacillus sp. LDC-1 TaxID=3039856 RepID=UPI0024DEA6B5|nr:HAD hydrolase-like protein [Virgibacillus sp. LDC-1]
MTQSTLHAVHQQMLRKLAVFGAHVDDIAYCSHKPHEGCPCRKPQPKMLLDLAKKHHIDLARSYMVGERKQDIEAGS